MTTRAQTKYSDTRAPIVFIVNVNYTCALHTRTHPLYLKMAGSMKLATQDAQRMPFSQNHDVGSADGDDDGDDVDFEHPDSDGSFDFQGKNNSKSSESAVVCTNCDTIYCLCTCISLYCCVVSRL